MPIRVIEPPPTATGRIRIIEPAPASKPQRSPVSVVRDVGKSFASGLYETLANANPMNAFVTGPVVDAVYNAANLGGQALDLMSGKRPVFKAPASPGARMSRLQIQTAGQDYEPQTTAGKWAKTAGMMTPNALAPGSALARTAAVVLPTIGTEGAGQIAHNMGASPEVEAGARFAGGLAGGLASSIRVTPRVKAPAVATIKPQDLKAAKTAAYQAADQAGVAYRPESFDGLISSIDADLQASRINPLRHPKAASMLEEIQSMKGQAPTLTELDQLRQVVRRDVAGSDAEKFFANRMIKQIDAFVDGAGPQDVVSGNADDAAALINNARDLNTRYRKVESVTTALDRAERRAGRTGSGGNSDNATRQNLDRILETTPNLTKEEAAALRSIVMGGKGQNLLRQIGKLSPQGNGIMAAANLGAAAAAGPLGAIPGAAGLISKMAADNMTRAKVEKLIALMAAGGKKAPVPPVNAFAQPPRLTFEPGAGLVGSTAINTLAETR